MKKSTSERGHATRDDWLIAGLEALNQIGPSGLNIQNLARELKISKTSFYWHFSDRASFVDELVSYWTDQLTNIVTSGEELLDTPPERRLAMAMEMIDEHDLAHYDLAFRVWARSDDHIAAGVHRVNEIRLDFARTAFAELGFTGIDLEARSALFVGYHSTERFVFAEFSDAKRKELRDDRLRILLSDCPRLSSGSG